MTTYITTITEMVVHPTTSTNPLLASGAIAIKLIDEGGGAFFELTGTDDASGVIRAELGEIIALADAAQALMRQLPAPEAD